MAEATEVEPAEPPRSLAFAVLVVAAIYFVSGRLGLEFANTQANATLIWPPTGLALAATVRFGWRVWPGIFVGAALTNASIGTSMVASLGIAAGNTLEAVVGATLLVHVARFDPAFARLRDVIAFLVYGSLISTLVSATIGVGVLVATGAVPAAEFTAIWLIWWLGDAGGAIIVAPLILVGLSGRSRWSALVREPEAWFALALLIAVAAVGFGGGVATTPEALLPALLVFPVLVWVGLRLGPLGATVGSFAVGTIAVLGTASGVGPFVASGSHSLFLVWAYLSSVGAVAMILAAAVAERELAEAERRRGETERASLAVQMQHTQRLESLGLLAGGIAHDFNNLLVPIRGNAELLKLELDIGLREREAMLDAIELASVQAAGLCRQLLTYAGHHRIDRQRVDLATLIDELAPLLRTSTPRLIELDIDSGALPMVEGDPGQIGQVLMNLVINATEAIGARPGRVRVRRSVRELDADYLAHTFLHSDAPAGRYVAFEVVDDGAGMTPEVLERIFDPFFSTKRTGRGLGMASVLGIVLAHAGAIKVTSEPGRGTTFTILLPVAVPVAAAPDPVPVAPSPAHRAATVLVAEDEEPVLKVTRRLLEAAGYTVVVAADGLEAVARFSEAPERIDALLFDVNMPRLGGPEALAQIQALRPGIPAVLVSGYDEGRVEASRGCVFLQKPYRRDALLRTLAEVLSEAASPAASAHG